MKSLRPLLLAALLLAPGFSRAEENRYDVLSKLLLPFAHVLTKDAKTPNRALRLTARLERLTDLPPALVGSRAEIAVQYPDKFRLPARLSVARTGWQMVVRCERLEFSKALPPETWQPTAEQAGDILRLDAARYGQLLEFITK